MALPIRATLEDINQTCVYLSSKPTGASLKDIASVVGEKLADARRIAALQSWGLVEAQEGGRYKVTDDGRRCGKGDAEKVATLQSVIRRIPAYLAIIERAAHRKEDAITSNEAGAHWHDHFKGEASDSEETLKHQTISFFQVAEGANLGTMIVGRRGAETRFSFNADALSAFVGATQSLEPAGQSVGPPPMEEKPDVSSQRPASLPRESDREITPQKLSGQGIFIAHGKNKKPLEQLKTILEQFRIPYKIATEEPNLGRPISAKIREIMQACNCAILIFTADEEFKNSKGETIWRPSENVVYELGASGYLYDNRLVILKEDTVSFPSNFRDIGYISFDKDKLDAKAMDVLKELIGFGIVRVST
jgi:predicted nucleotide-binding protein/Mn-dependent DtxR family transcriptional regulator